MTAPWWKRLVELLFPSPDPDARCGCGDLRSECDGNWPACNFERWL